jgi:putative membrane protein
MKKGIVALTSAVLVTLFACNKSEEPAVVINPQDIGFVHSATLNNAAEIALGQLAFDSSQTPEIKAYGQQMVNEHSQLQGELEALASSMNIPTPDTLEQRHIQLMNDLRTRKGRSFDSLYIHSQVPDHQNALVIYGNTHGLGNNNQLKDYSRNAIPILLQHLQEAQNLAAGY